MALFAGPRGQACRSCPSTTGWGRRPRRPPRPARRRRRHRRRRRDGMLSDIDATVLSIEEWNAATGQPADPEPSTTDGEDVAVLLYTSGTTAAPRPRAAPPAPRARTSSAPSSSGAPRSRRHARQRAAVPHRRRGQRAVERLRRPAARVPAGVHARGVARRRCARGHHQRHGRAHHARPGGRAPRRPAAATARPCGRWPTAGPACRSRCWSGRSSRSRTPDFVNAYGLTETSSTIAVLGPDDHRDDRRPARAPVGAGSCRASRSTSATARSGCAASRCRASTSGPAPLDADGWFPTRDRGWVDDDGYLFIEGRADDTIIRGGENIAPAEIEDVLLTHPAVASARVVGPARRRVGPAHRRGRGAAAGTSVDAGRPAGVVPRARCAARRRRT